MTQHRTFPAPDPVCHVNTIALRALAALLHAAPSAENTRQITLTDCKIGPQLRAAVTQPDGAAFDAAIDMITAADISHAHIANNHIAPLARALGQDWVDGKMAFTDVSIACARLQGYLRHQGLDWCDTAQMTMPHAGSVLLAVPDFDQHTLGATLLAGQLRAQGFDVTLALHMPANRIVQTASAQDYDAILMSCSRSETLASLAQIVQKLRIISTSTPIILGGNVLEQTADVLMRTGADLTANCWQDVESILMPAQIHVGRTGRE